jgi:hypothetical protein
VFCRLKIKQVYWLGIWMQSNHGQQRQEIGITTSIQAEINESAKDLFQCMKMVTLVYANQIEALQSEFRKL